MATNDINSIIVESLSVAKWIISVGMSIENLEKPLQPEASHFKCRYDINNRNCQTKLYTRTTNIERFPVPDDKIKWTISYDSYNPTNFTADKVKKRKGPDDYKDPDCNENDYKNVKFNIEPKISHYGIYKIQFNEILSASVPLNPVGRTGICGRGHLGKWGPNHAADPIVTRWKRDENGEKVLNQATNLPILQFVAVKRRDTKEWAIPGGMIDPSEFANTTFAREFAEEALSKEFTYIKKNVNHKMYSIVAERNSFDKKYNDFFLNGQEIYRGYVDDPRNTDNAWMETVVYNFHDENNEFVGELQLNGGSDAEDAIWMDVESSLKLFASHSEFLKKVAIARKAHW